MTQISYSKVNFLNNFFLLYSDLHRPKFALCGFMGGSSTHLKVTTEKRLNALPLSSSRADKCCAGRFSNAINPNIQSILLPGKMNAILLCFVE